jgi:hypothetical protein
MKTIRKLISLIALFSLLFGLFPSAALAVEPDHGDYEAVLYAGKPRDGADNEVGGVQVWNDTDTLSAQFEVEAPWCMTEVHLQVAADSGAIPQTQPNNKGLGGGNPIPGQFAVNEKMDGCVRQSPVYTWDISQIDGWNGTGSLAIAAHTVVNKSETSCKMVPTDESTQESLTIVSDTDTFTGSAPAVATWTHPVWSASIPGATWIWNSYYVSLPAEGETVDFSREFNIEGTVTSAALDIATDNTYSVSVNGTLIGSSADLDNFRLGTQDHYDVTQLTDNSVNTLTASVNNPYWNTTDPTVNPAGLLYKLSVNYDKPVYEKQCEDVLVASESAWAGEEDFTGANWARFFRYDMQCAVYTLEIDSVNNNYNYTHDYELTFCPSADPVGEWLKGAAGEETVSEIKWTDDVLSFTADYVNSGYIWYPAFILENDNTLNFRDLSSLDNVWNATGIWSLIWE